METTRSGRDIDHSRVVVHEPPTVLSNLHRDVDRIFRISLSEISENAAQSSGPLVFLFARFARVGGAQLDQKLLAYVRLGSQPV
jgi:hypothetical protein